MPEYRQSDVAMIKAVVAAWGYENLGAVDREMADNVLSGRYVLIPDCIL